MLKLLLKTPKSAAKPLKGLRLLTTQTIPQNPLSSSSSSSSSTTTSTLTSKPKKDILYYRLVPVWDPSLSVLPILDEWVTQGRSIHPNELRKIIKQFRKYKRFKHALEISEWMGDAKLVDLTLGEVAIRLDLISKVHGIEQAETYFDSIPESLRVLEVYSALLNCYAHSKALEKAENIMQKMRDLDYCKVLNYNVMMNLYFQMGMIDKLDSLLKEMEEKGVNCDKYSFNIRLNAYATAFDIEGMEKLLMKMEAAPSPTTDWLTYVLPAKTYLNAGNTEKALEMLHKSEQLIEGSKGYSGYQVLLTLYASAGKKSDVYRVWDQVKMFAKFRNINYLSMLSSLRKLDDLEGAEKIVEEWLAKKVYFDIRIPNSLVTAYCERGHLDKAELLIKQLISSGYKPNASTWYRLSRGYLMCNDKEKAVEMVKKAVEISDRGVKVDFFALGSCVEYLKENGDIDKAEELIQVLEKRGPFSVDIRERLMVCISNGSLASEELSLSEGEAEETLE